MQKIVINSINILMIGSMIGSGVLYGSHTHSAPQEEQGVLNLFLKDASEPVPSKSYFESAWDNVNQVARKIPAIDPRPFLYTKTQSFLNSAYITGAWALGATALTSALRYSTTARKAFIQSTYYDKGRVYVNNLRNGDKKTLAYTGGAIAVILALYYRKQIASLIAQLAGYGDEAAAVSQDPRIAQLQEQLRVAQEAQARLAEELQRVRANGDLERRTAQETEGRLRNELQIALEDAQSFEKRITVLQSAQRLLNDENTTLNEELGVVNGHWANARKQIQLLEQELEELSESTLRPYSMAVANTVPFNIRTVPLSELRQIQDDITAEERAHGLIFDSAQVTLLFNRDGYVGRTLEFEVVHDDTQQDADLDVTHDESE